MPTCPTRVLKTSSWNCAIQLLQNRHTTVRLLNYVNHGNMGDYSEAVKLYLDHVTPTPDVDRDAESRDGEVWLRRQLGAGTVERPVAPSPAGDGPMARRNRSAIPKWRAYFEVGVYAKGRAGAGRSIAWVRPSSPTEFPRAHQSYLANGGLGFCWATAA